MDPFLLLTPILVLGVLALFGFVGCGLSDFNKPPLAPTLNAVGGDERVYLFWDPSEGGDLYDYQVWRSTTAGGPYALVTSLSPTARSFTDRSLTNGTEYFYLLRASEGRGTYYSEETFADSAEIAATPAAAEFKQLTEGSDFANGKTVGTAPFGDVVRASSLIVVWVWYNDSSVHVETVTDSRGNVYLPAADPVRGQNNLNAFKQEIWYLGNVNGGPDVVVTATFSVANGAEKRIVAHEYSGLHPSDPLDKNADTVGASANASSGSVTSADAVLVFGAAVFDAQGDAGPGFQKRSGLGQNVTEDRRADASGTAEATFVNTAQEFIAQVVTFK